MTGGPVYFEMVPLSPRYMLNWLREVVKGQAERSGLCNVITGIIPSQGTLSIQPMGGNIIPKSPYHPALLPGLSYPGQYPVFLFRWHNELNCVPQKDMSKLWPPGTWESDLIRTRAFADIRILR